MDVLTDRQDIWANNGPSVLKKVNIKSCPNEQLRGIVNFPSQFSFEIICRPGLANTKVDCLSGNQVLLSDKGDVGQDSIRKVNI